MIRVLMFVCAVAVGVDQAAIAFTQGETTLNVFLVKSIRSKPTDDKLTELMMDLVNTLHAPRLGAPFLSVNKEVSDYHTSSASLRHNSLGTLTPLQYLSMKRILGDDLVPLFLVKKRHEQTAYFSAFFITGKGSNIRSLRDSTKIHKLILVDSHSTSGYVMPLFELYQAGIISEPTERGCIQKGWTIEFGGHHAETVDLLAQNADAIAAVGGFPNQDDPKHADVRVLLRYGAIPQDVFFITSDLLPLRAAIEEWWNTALLVDSTGRYVNPRASILDSSSSALTGLVPFGEEHSNAYAELETISRYVYGKTKPPIRLKGEILSLEFASAVLGTTSWSERLSAGATMLTVLLFCVGIGHRWGSQIFSLVRSVKSLWSDPLGDAPKKN